MIASWSGSPDAEELLAAELALLVDDWVLLFEALDSLLESSELVLDSLALLFPALALLIEAAVLLAATLELLDGGAPVEALELLAGGFGLSMEALELVVAAGVELSIEELELLSAGAELLTFSLELLAGGLDVAEEALLPVEEDAPPFSPEFPELLEPPQADSTATELINSSPFIRRWPGHRSFSFRIAFSVMNQTRTLY